MKTIIFALPLFLAANLGLAYPSDPASKGLPPLTKGLPPLTKGLPPLPGGLPSPLTKGLPPPPPTTQTKGLPPPPPTTQTKGLPPQGPNSLLNVLPPEAAGLITTITPECQAAIFSIVISPEFLKCIPIPSFIPLIPVITDPSIITKFLADPAKNYPPLEKPLVQFATAFCPAPKCSDKGVAEAVKTLSEGCKADLKKNKFIQMLVGVATLYSPLHDSICFQNPKKVFCWDETILTVISLPKSPIKIVDGGIIDSVAVADPDKVCTKCNRAIINTFGNFIKEHSEAGAVLNGFGVPLDLVKVGVAVKCGINFEDGKVGNPGK